MGMLEEAIELLKEVERCIPMDLSGEYHRTMFMGFVQDKRLDCEGMLK